MIGVQGQFLLSFDLANQDADFTATDFITTDDFRMFQTEETADGQLPKFKLSFDTDTANLSYLNETSTLTISMGSTMDDMVQTTMYITELDSGRYGNRRRVVAQGLLNAAGYLNNTRSGITDKKSGIEALTTVAQRYFNIDSNVTQSTDSQNWIQHNTSDKDFLSHCHIASNLPGSFPAFGISALNNTFVLRDMQAHLATDAQWNFVPDDIPTDDGKSIPYHGDYTVRNTSGFVNTCLGGYDTQQPIFNIEQGLQNDITGIADSFMSGASSLLARGISGGIDAIRKGTFTTQTENMHDTYHQTRQNNVKNLATSSSFKVTLSWSKLFYAVKVLDHVSFMENSDDTDGSPEYASGSYVISKVERFFTGRQHATRVELTRDGPGGR